MNELINKLISALKADEMLAQALEKAIKLEEDGASFWQWFEVGYPSSKLNKLVLDGIIRVVYRGSSSGYHYRLADLESTKQALKLYQTMEVLPPVKEEIAIPHDLFDIVIGHEDEIKVLKAAIDSDKPVHVLLVGPPSSGKSTILLELMRLPNSRFALGGSTSRAGLADFLLMHKCRYLIIDEIDTMPLDDLSILYSLMEAGIVARLKKGMTELERMKVSVFGACISDSRLPEALRSRFLTLRFRPYTEEEFKQVCMAVLTKREGLSNELATYIAEKLVRYTRDPRDAVKVSRLVKSKADVDWLVGVMYRR